MTADSNRGKWPKGWAWGLWGGLLALDQITKIWAIEALAPYGSREVIPGFFSLTYVQNTGVAFGFLAGHNWILGVAVALLLGVGLYWARELDWRLREVNLVAALLLSGAVGNLIDRIRHGYVVDFLDFYVGTWHWPAFNVADSCICLSVAWLLWRNLTGLQMKKG
jgi:signal peptidase II